MSAAVNIYADFTAETDAFRLEADVEDDVDEKWQKLAEHLLGEKQSERCDFKYLDFTVKSFQKKSFLEGGWLGKKLKIFH